MAIRDLYDINIHFYFDNEYKNCGHLKQRPLDGKNGAQNKILTYTRQILEGYKQER